MPQDLIQRSLSKMDPELFRELLELNIQRPWLQSEPEALVELWNLCDNANQRQLLSLLIKRFEVIDSRKLNMCGKDVARTISVLWRAQPTKTRIVAVSDQANADGSQAFLQSLKNKFSDTDGWSEKCFVNDLRSAINESKNGWTIILLDDFIGTGKTIKRKSEWFSNKLKEENKNGVSLKIVAIAGMQSAKKALDELGFDYYCPLWLPKGLSECSEIEDLEASKTLMIKLERKLGAFFKGLWLPSFGYGKCEALFCVEAYNVPNNVFPVFWWPVLKDKSRRATLFKRLR